MFYSDVLLTLNSFHPLKHPFRTSKNKKSNFYLVVRLCTWTCGNQTSNQTAFERRDSYRTHYHVTKIVALSLMLDLVNESKQATTSNQMMQSVMAISAACKYMHSKSEQRF